MESLLCHSLVQHISWRRRSGQLIGKLKSQQRERRQGQCLADVDKNRERYY